MKDLHELYPKFPAGFPLPFILDGATGTALMKRGMPSGACTESWVLENPDVLREVQKLYRESGSNAVYAPTFGANAPTLARHKMKENVTELNKKLAALTVTEGSLTGGDMSPTGLFIEPYGDTPFDDVVDIYAEQAKGLLEAGVDFFVAETMINLNELRAAVMGVRQVSDKPIFATLTVDERGRTMSGDDLEAAFIVLCELGVSAVGTNCSVGPDKMLEVLSKLTPLSLAYGVPLIAKPNAGMPHEDEQGCQHFDLGADEFASYARRFADAGALLLGGCCGSDESFIAALKAQLDGYEPNIQAKPCDITGIAATNREWLNVTDTDEVVEVDEEFPDTIDEDADYVCLSVADTDAAEIFCEQAFSLTQPIAMTGDPEAVEYCKRYYNGKIHTF
ncbi:MAG: homocysteine S-methyltransferase family protein [Clostridia bacterium]|nr:homocysteine S-methyltransferase family protein [Clostridia bacterium]